MTRVQLPRVSERQEPRGRSKFGAVRTEVDGLKFASKAEARRYSELKLLEKAGEIAELVLQPRFALAVPCEHSGADEQDPPVILGVYIADFSYLDMMRPRGQLVIEDVKGFATPLYKWKRKHVEAQYGIKVIEIRERAKATQ